MVSLPPLAKTEPPPIGEQSDEYGWGLANQAASRLCRRLPRLHRRQLPRRRENPAAAFGLARIARFAIPVAFAFLERPIFAWTIIHNRQQSFGMPKQPWHVLTANRFARLRCSRATEEGLHLHLVNPMPQPKPFPSQPMSATHILTLVAPMVSVVLQKGHSLQGCGPARGASSSRVRNVATTKNQRRLRRASRSMSREYKKEAWLIVAGLSAPAPDYDRAALIARDRAAIDNTAALNARGDCRLGASIRM